MASIGPTAPPNSWLKRKFLSEETDIIINATSHYYHYVKTERNDQIERQGWLLAENYHHRWLQVVKHQHQQVNWLLVVDQIMLTTVCHSKIFITNLMTGKCHHQPSSFLSRTSPPYLKTVISTSQDMTITHSVSSKAVLNNVVFYLEEPPDKALGEVDFSLPHPSDQVLQKINKLLVSQEGLF